MKSTIIKIVLGIGVVLLAYFGLYANLKDEIHIRKVMDERKKENIERLQDLREIQFEYKHQKGYYCKSAEELNDFLNEEIKFSKKDDAMKDSIIPVDRDKWKRIRKEISMGKTNLEKEAKRIYEKDGGEWKIFTEKEKIDRKYIKVNYYKAHELAFTADYQKTRNNSYKIDIQNLKNIRGLYNNQKSYNNFKSEYNAYSDEIINKLEINSIYNDINSNFNAVFDLDTNTKISTENLKSKISENQTEIKTLKSKISDEEDSKKTAEAILNSVIKEQNKYIDSTIGVDMIEKVRKKAVIKKEKGKKLKGRKGIIWDNLYKQDSTKQTNTEIVETCKESISKFKNEIKSREKLIKSLKKNIQSIHDVNAMQDMYINRESVVNTNFDDLASYIINKEIKEVIILKKVSPEPLSLEKWDKAKSKADELAEQSIDEEMLAEIRKRYEEEGGKYRPPTTEEGYTRGLIVDVTELVKDYIFDDIYMKNRSKDIPLNLDSITYIPHTQKQYAFDAEVGPKYDITNALLSELLFMQLDIESDLQMKEPLILSIQEKIALILDLGTDEETATTIYDTLGYYEKVQIVILLEKMEDRWSSNESKKWEKFSKRFKLEYIRPIEFFVEISAEYDQVYDGLDKKEKILRNVEERTKERIQIGSLDEIITNGNWGE